MKTNDEVLTGSKQPVRRGVRPGVAPDRKTSASTRPIARKSPEELMMNVLANLREQLLQCGSVLALLEHNRPGDPKGQPGDAEERRAAIQRELAWLRKVMVNTDRQLKQLATALKLPAQHGAAEVIQVVPAAYRPALQALLQENQDRLRQLQEEMGKAGLASPLKPGQARS